MRSRSWSILYRWARTGGLGAVALAVGSCVAPQGEDWGESPAMLGAPAQTNAPAAIHMTIAIPRGRVIRRVISSIAAVTPATAITTSTGSRYS